MRGAVVALLEASEGNVTAWKHAPARTDIDPRAQALLTTLNATKVEFTSGSHVVFLSEAVEANTETGAKMAVVEMWALGHADQLVVTEGSSFGDVSRSLFQHPSYVTTLGGRCYPAATSSPVGAGFMYYEQATCFNKKSIHHDWLWKLQDKLKA